MSRNTRTIKNLILVLIVCLGFSPAVFAQISVSNGVTISAVVGSGSGTTTSTTPVNPPVISGSGGGGGYFSTGATVTFSGRAYPLSKVTILQDSVPVVVTVAGQDANFSASVSNLSAGNYNFSIYGEDSGGHRSQSISFPLVVSANVTIDISGVFIAPTISLDKTQVTRGDNIIIFGETIPNSNVVISVHSNPETFHSVTTDKNGVYVYTLDTSPLELGSHVAKSKTVLPDTASPYGELANFIVGDKTVAQQQATCGAGIGDVNCDGSVGLIDYSILAFWYGKSNPPDNIDLNHDGQINLVDFSILAYYWTG